MVLTVLAYMAATFSVQALSHFAIHARHYGSIPIMRQEPILAMGILSMVIQGTVFALLFPVFNRGGLLLGLVHQKFPAPARQPG